MAISDLSHMGGHQMSFEVQHLMGCERDAFRLKGTGLELSIQENPPAKTVGSSWLPCVIGARGQRSQAGPASAHAWKRLALHIQGLGPFCSVSIPNRRVFLKMEVLYPLPLCPLTLEYVPLPFGQGWPHLLNDILS